MCGSFGTKYPWMARQNDDDGNELMRTWLLPSTATMGSAVRAKGIVQEINARLPAPVRKLVEHDVASVTLTMSDTSRSAFRAAVAMITDVLANAAALPVIPREIEDILAITSTERRRWLEDGRLPSTGTRTVRLRGRARAITFHVFDPQMVVQVLDSGSVDEWREHDKEGAEENRRRAAHKRKLTRTLAKQEKAKSLPSEESAPLEGWAEFGADGLLH